MTLPPNSSAYSGEKLSRRLLFPFFDSVSPSESGGVTFFLAGACQVICLVQISVFFRLRARI